MKRLGILMLACWVWGCGEKPDELTPYVAKLKGLQHYNETLAQYKTYLRTEGMTNKANDIAQVLQSYKADLEAIGRPEEKRILALHNSMIRTIDEALRKLVEPDFPTFVPNAQKAVAFTGEGVEKMQNNLGRWWKEAGNTEPLPFSWPAADK